MKTKNLIMAVAIAAMPFALAGTADAAAVCPNGYISTNPFNHSEQIVIPDGIQQGTSEAQNRIMAQRAAQVYQQKIEQTYNVGTNDFSILRDDSESSFTLCYIPNTQLKRELGLEVATSTIKSGADDNDVSTQMANSSDGTTFNLLNAFVAEINDSPYWSDEDKEKYINYIKQLDEDELSKEYADYQEKVASVDSARKEADEVQRFLQGKDIGEFGDLAMHAYNDGTEEPSSEDGIIATVEEVARDVISGAGEKLKKFEDDPVTTVALGGALGMVLAGAKAASSASNSPVESATGEEAYEIVKGRKRDEELVKRIHGYVTKGITGESASDVLFEPQNIEQGMYVRSIPYSEF